MQLRSLARWMPLALCFLSITLLIIPGLAQRIFGDILGNVTDPSGAAVTATPKPPCATLTRDVPSRRTTGGDGAYFFVN